MLAASNDADALTQITGFDGNSAGLAHLPYDVAEHYVAQHNSNPKPFVWTAKASDILEKVKRLERLFISYDLFDALQ